MPVWVRIEAAGLEELAIAGITQQNVMHALTAQAQTLPPPPIDTSIPPPPVPFLTPTDVLS